MESQPDQSTPAPENQPQKRRGTSWLLWLFLLLFVVYPLSSGPVVRLWKALGLAQDPVLGLYTPLVFLAFYFPGFRSLFMWYLGLWKA
ncbi:MAG TPA: hypothetical protein VJA21_04985, partial [Verrucomicrobiae bacterium]